ncbi:MAG: CDP-alcohol phosphatidyltransferase family protein [Acidobacteria bacterium]|nr:CDP-alcohol phosphatidyltransferase family protein [Acidobacteriota bacterium]
MSHKGLKKGLFLIPTSFTAANIAMGFLAVLASLRGFQIVVSNPENAAVYFNYAAVAIGLAILFDTLDGRLARMTKTSTELGVQLDSLADVLTFGIAPVTLLYGWGIGAAFSETSSVHRIGIFVLFSYLMCGVLRLARFNIQATRPRVLKAGTPKIDKKNFVGLPIPPAAGLIAAVVHFAPYPLSYYGETYGKFYATLILLILPVLAGLMVCTLKYTSFKNVGTGKRNLYLILVLGAVGMLVWLYSHYVLLAIAVAYVSHGLIWYLMGLLRLRKRSDESTEE